MRDGVCELGLQNPRAQVYQVLGRYEEALDEIWLAKRLSPRDVDFSYFLSVEALILMSMGDWEPAVNVAQNAITLSPLNHNGHVTRIMSLYARGDREEVTRAVRDMLNAVPHFSTELVWNVPLPDSLMPSVAPLQESQAITHYPQAVAAVLKDLQ